MEEQFIHDAISNGPRLQRVINLLMNADWRWYDDEEGDLLNQEFNFSAGHATGVRTGGRVDVLATFNGRTRLAIIETKVAACEDDLKQLFWYMDNCRQICGGDQEHLAQVDCEKVIGILLAHDFAPGVYAPGGRNAHVVRFRFAGGAFPFEVPAVVPEKSEAGADVRVFKLSRLNTLAEHREWMNADLRDAFDELARLCLQQDDRRLAWVITNPKTSHIAIHYKGRYVMWFFVQRKAFDVGYSLPGGQTIHKRVSTAEGSQETVLERARTELPSLLESIDAQDTLRGIPSEFDWNACDND